MAKSKNIFHHALLTHFEDATKQGKKNITVRCKDFHDEANPPHPHRRPHYATCSGIMWVETAAGDCTILYSSPSGIGSNLTIRYGLPRQPSEFGPDRTNVLFRQGVDKQGKHARRDAFRRWLKETRRNTDSTIQTKVALCRRVEETYGDLDALYDQGRIEYLLDKLCCAPSGEPRHRIPLMFVKSKPKSTADFKYAVKAYFKFRQSGKRVNA